MPYKNNIITLYRTDGVPVYKGASPCRRPGLDMPPRGSYIVLAGQKFNIIASETRTTTVKTGVGSAIKIAYFHPVCRTHEPMYYTVPRP